MAMKEYKLLERINHFVVAQAAMFGSFTLHEWWSDRACQYTHLWPYFSAGFILGLIQNLRKRV
jgi:hypothetical protein